MMKPINTIIGIALVLVAGCGTNRPTPQNTPAEQPEAEPAQANTNTEPSTPILLSTEADFDGTPGNERVILYSDGTLSVGNMRGQVEITVDGDADFIEQASLQVVVLDRTAGTRAIVIGMPGPLAEDPPNDYQVFMAQGQDLQKVLTIEFTDYGVTELRFPGDGTIRYIESGWTACIRAGENLETMPDQAEIQEVIYRRQGETLSEASRVNTGQIQDCDQLAACPSVYLVGSDGTTTFVGEILRNLRGAGAYANQELELPELESSVLHLRLIEEEPEITFLDEIYLEVDGNRISPRSCVDSSPAYCAADQRMELLRHSETLDLTFDIPQGSHHATLYATGFYVPFF